MTLFNMLLLVAGLAMIIVPLFYAVAHYSKRNGYVSAANTYDAAVEVHDTTVRRTNDVAVTARHLLWAPGATPGTTIALATASSRALGTVDNTETATGVGMTVNLLGRGTTKKMVANAEITAGALVYQAADGKIAPTGTILVGRALTGAAADNDVVEVLDINPVQVPSTHYVYAAGIHDWAGGAATADSIAIVGLLATDVVICQLVARASTETLVLAGNDAGNDQIDLTLSANGTNTTTKIAYQVLRPV